MGFFRKVRLASEVATKSWSQPPVWSPDHPLSSIWFADNVAAERERIGNNFEGYAQGALKANGPVMACVLARQMVFSEARFQWRRLENGRPTDLFGSTGLELLERPWPGGTTGELLAHMEQDVSLAGNFWATVADDAGRLGAAATGPGRRIVRMRPDWVTLIIGSRSGDPWALDARVLSILYEPKSSPISGQPRADAVQLLPEEVCHYSPIPDPTARFRGMSWLTPVLREIEADTAATEHKRNFFENAAVPNMVVKFDKDTDEDAFEEFVTKYNRAHRGAWNAYKTLFLMGGADVTPLTHDFSQMDFSQTIGKGESRIAAAAGVPSSWVGFSEGMQGSSLNAGNFAAARRRFADGTIRPLWRIAAASLQQLVTPPDAGAELWYDERDIAFLREDARDRAEIMRINLNALDAGIKAGFDADAVTEAVRDDDVSKLLGSHTGLVSVQMQAPRSAESREFGVDATAIAALVTAGYTRESVVKAAVDNDVSKLVADPKAVLPTTPAQPAASGGGGGPQGDVQRPDSEESDVENEDDHGQ
jgi:phage portal protein BeeE